MNPCTIQLKKFPIHTMDLNAKIAVVGKPGTGKSSMIEHLLYTHKYIPKGISMVGTMDGVDDMKRFMPDTYVYEGYNKTAVEQLLECQKKIRKKLMKKGYEKHEIQKDPSWASFLVIDDCMEDTKWIKDKITKDIFKNGRHYNMFFILAMQYCMSLTTDLRSCLDYVFIFKENLQSNRKRLYEHYCGIFPNFDMFERVLMACTENYECMVIDNRSISNNIADVVYWYKAELHEDEKWRLGNNDYWKYHTSKYDKHYDDSDDDVQSNIYDTGMKKTKNQKIRIEKYGY